MAKRPNPEQYSINMSSSKSQPPKSQQTFFNVYVNYG